MTSSVRTALSTLLILAIIMICGGVLRVAFLPHEALDGDEVFSRYVVRLPPAQEIAAIEEDLVHPPAYYFILQATTKLWGTSPLGIRAFSVLCGLASIGLIFIAGNALPGSRWTGLLAAALAAVNVPLIFFSQEARSYAWYALLCLVLFLWVLRVTGGGSLTLKHWVGGAVVMCLLFYTHFVGAIYVACAIGAILVADIPARRRLFALACAGIAALSFVPWLLIFLRVLKAKHGLDQNLSWQGIPSIYQLRALYASALGVPAIKGANAVAADIIVFLTAMLLWWKRPPGLRQSPAVLALCMLSFMPPAILFLLPRAPFNLPIYDARHLLPSVMLLILLCSYSLDMLVQRTGPRAGLLSALVAAVGCVVLLGLAVPSAVHVMVRHPTRIPYDLVAKEVMLERSWGVPAYDAASYVGDSVRFYCAMNCTRELVFEMPPLEDRIALIYQPGVAAELAQYRRLIALGYSESENDWFTGAPGVDDATEVVILRRRQ